MFYKKQIDGKDVYCSDMIETEHFFTSRDLIVKDNVDVISEYLEIEPKNLIHPVQTHSDNVRVVEGNLYSYENTDALILTSKDKAIYLNFADCTPIIIYDYKNNIAYKSPQIPTVVDESDEYYLDLVFNIDED